MKTIWADPKRIIKIGRLGENERLRVGFNVSDLQEELPGATFIVINKGPADENSYPCSGVTVEDNAVFWPITSADLRAVGEGKCELIATVDNVVAKTIIYNTMILEALDGSGEVPTPWEDWGAEFAGMVADAQNAASSAVTASEAAVTSAETAEAASQAIQDMSVMAVKRDPGTGVTVGKFVNPETGAVQLRFGIEQGDPGFSPEITVLNIQGGHRVIITSEDGTSQTFDVMDGANGADGATGPQGEPGFSPTVQVTDITGGHQVAITDTNGTQTFDVMDGEVTQEEFDELKSQISNIKNLTPNEVLSGTYSGTRYTTVNDLTIPAGTYRLTVDNVTSTDTDKTTCRVEFKNGSTDVLVLQLDRNVPIDMEITLDAQVANISFYASSLYAYTTGDTFSFNNFAISEVYNLLAKLNDIDDDILVIDGRLDGQDTQIESLNNVLKFFEITYLVKASTEHVSDSDKLSVNIPAGLDYRVELSADITVSNDINIKAYYSDGTSEYVKSGAHIPSVNSLTASKKIVAFGFWSASSFSTNNVNITVDVYVDGSVLDVYKKIDWDETPVFNDFQIKTLKVLDSFTPNIRSYSFNANATISNYNDYATTSSVAYNTPPIKIRNKDGTLIYKNLHVTPKDASTYAAWMFDIDGKYLRSVTFSAMSIRQTPFLTDEYYAILNEYPNTAGYTETHWYVSNIDIEWLNGKNEYTVGPSGDFTTFTAMLIALENDTSEKTVYVQGGTYDIFTEMGGADYIASVAPSVSELNWRDVCHVVPPNTRIVGVGNVVLSWQPTAEQMISESVAFLFSPLNVSGTCEIENISVVAKNCRYVVHDETSGLAQYNGAKHYYKNCRFTLLSGSYGFILYGAGHNKLMDIRFDDCVFDSQNASMIWSTHDWGTAVNDNSVFVFNSCVFISSIANPYVRFSSTDSVGRLDKVMFNNCYLQRIKFVTTSGSNAKQGYDIQLIGCSPVEVEYDEHVTDRVAVRQYNPIPQTT